MRSKRASIQLGIQQALARELDAAGTLDAHAFDGIDAVVHLAGAGIADHRWTDAYKRELLESRTRGTALVAGTIAGATNRPKMLLSGSLLGLSYKPYLSLSGTSMSAPVVAGTVALMLQASRYVLAAPD